MRRLSSVAAGMHYKHTTCTGPADVLRRLYGAVIHFRHYRGDFADNNKEISGFMARNVEAR